VVPWRLPNLNISLAGNWTNNGGVYTPGTNITIFNGSGAQAYNGTASSQHLMMSPY